ncbi:MAG: putative lyase [Pedosphaera sp.]|nr:putative lyase [Pedosphaera sp.]
MRHRRFFGKRYAACRRLPIFLVFRQKTSHIAAMTKRLRWLLAILLVAIAGGLAWRALAPHEPVYRGKSLSAWLESYPVFNVPVEGQEQRANEAVRHMGTNALPALLAMAQTRDSHFKNNLTQLLSKQSLIDFDPTPAFAQRRRAVYGFDALGATAEPAIPKLTELLNNPALAYEAADALAKISPKAIPPLIDALTNQNFKIRVLAARALGVGLATDLSADVATIPRLGSNPHLAILALISAAQDTNKSVRLIALFSLGRIAQEPEVVIPALLALLSAGDADSRSGAAQALAQFGENARPAIPTLIKLLGNRTTVDNAAMALARIGWEGVSPLTEALANPDGRVRVRAALALGKYIKPNPGEEPVKPRTPQEIDAAARIAIPALLNRLQDPDPMVRSWSAWSLGCYARDPELVVPALSQLLANREIRPRSFAIIALQQFGTNAQSAVPILLNLLQDSSFNVRESTTNALKAIDPSAAAKAGVQ